MNSARMRAAGVLLLLGGVFAAGFFTGNTHIGGISSAQTPADLSQFWKAWSVLEEEYVPTHASSTIPEPKERVYGAIAGLVGSYEDPYTVFMPPAEAKIFQEDISGAFEGVGMEMDQTNTGELVVISPLKGSPAEAAGIKSRDIIRAINGTSTAGMQVGDAVKLIRGKKGTTVRLSLERDGKPLEVSVVRDTITIQETNVYKRADGIFVIQLYQFSANSADLFRDALRQFVESGSDKLIFDLRGNPGGYLESAVQMSSFFLPIGQTIVTEDYKGHSENVVHRSLGYNVFANRKLSMAILVDQGSASASEILAGALQQHGVAKLVGTRTFGKGSVQELVDLGEGAQLKVTIARWLTPNGSSISDGGLTPDIAATRTQDDYKAGKDPQMDAAVKYLLGQ